MFEQRTFYIGSWRVKLILACQEVLKWVWPFMNRYKMSFVQTSTLPPHMHQKLTKHGRFYKQNNQLFTKNHVELEDNSIIWNTFFLTKCCRSTKGIWKRQCPSSTSTWWTTNLRTSRVAKGLAEAWKALCNNYKTKSLSNIIFVHHKFFTCKM
jgi:hypothetical protein